MSGEQENCIPVTGEYSPFPSILNPEITTLSLEQIELNQKEDFLEEGKSLMNEYPEIFEAVQNENGDYYIVSRMASFVDRNEGYTEEIVLITKNGIAFVYASKDTSKNNTLFSERALSIKDLAGLDKELKEGINIPNRFGEKFVRIFSGEPNQQRVTMIIPRTEGVMASSLSSFLKDIWENRYSTVVRRIRSRLESIYSSN